jgi:RNA recognition motif-containing protein
MKNKVFIGNLSYQTTEESLELKAKEFGSVRHVKIVKDAQSGKSKGYAFVTFDTDEAAAACIQKLDKQDFDGRVVAVKEAIEKHNKTK